MQGGIPPWVGGTLEVLFASKLSVYLTFYYLSVYLTFYYLFCKKNNDSPDSQDFSQKLTGILCKHVKSLVSGLILQLFNTVFNFNNQTKFVRLQMFVSLYCIWRDILGTVYMWHVPNVVYLLNNTFMYICKQYISPWRKICVTKKSQKKWRNIRIFNFKKN